MKLSELIDRAKQAIEAHGDMDVMAIVHYDEKCDKCGCYETHNKSGNVFSVDKIDDCQGAITCRRLFWIDAKEE